MKETRFWNSLSARFLGVSLIFLLALPWLGNRYLNEVKRFLLTGQQEAQLLAAKAVATVLSGHPDFFSIPNGGIVPNKGDDALYVYPLEQAIHVDGFGGDWGRLLKQSKLFSQESVVYDRTEGAVPPSRFHLILGEYGKYLYGLVNVIDAGVVYRHPQYVRLDNSDHIRLTYKDTQQKTVRLILTTVHPGQVSIYRMQKDWKTPSTGAPLYNVTGLWQETAQGYALEFRLPLTLFSPHKQFSLQVVNVSSPNERNIDNITATLPKRSEHEINPLLTRSPELDRILTGLDQPEVRLCVLDRYRRVRAVIGDEDLGSQLCKQTDTLSNALTSHALQGGSNVYQRDTSDGHTLFIAAQPIRHNGTVIGAVLLAKNSATILNKQRASLLNMLMATLAVTGLGLLTLLLLGSWLAFRLRRLQNEISQSIDENGRIIRHGLVTENNSSDEIGALSRRFSELLMRLQNYTGFIESVPRMLRHEILNPVNTLGLSLQALQPNETRPPTPFALPIKSAWHAIQQLELIVQSLTEAANVDEALRQDHSESFDLAAMLVEYVENSQCKHPSHRLTYQGSIEGVFVHGSDLRIAQLLDKLKDNALDFSIEGSEIVFALNVIGKQIELAISNDGDSIADDILPTLGLGMASHRLATDESPHLGIGLLVSSRIAQHHGGTLTIKNRTDGNGVCVKVEWPSCDETA